MSLPTRYYDSNFNTSPFPIFSLSPRSSSIYLCFFPLTTSFFQLVPFLFTPFSCLIRIHYLLFYFLLSLTLFFLSHFLALFFFPVFTILTPTSSFRVISFTFLILSSLPPTAYFLLSSQPTPSSPHSLLPPLFLSQPTHNHNSSLRSTYFSNVLPDYIQTHVNSKPESFYRRQNMTKIK